MIPRHLACSLLLAAATLAAPAPGNLVPNGDFEEGDAKQPAAWSPLDGLTTFYEAAGGHPGRCLRFDTSVQLADKKEFQAAPEQFKGRRESGNQYAAVGASEGVWAFSQPIAVLPNDKYFVIAADVRASRAGGAPMIFVRGYQLYDPARDQGLTNYFQVPHPGGPAYSELFGKAQRPAGPGDYLMVYRHSLTCPLAGTDWQHFRMAIKLPDLARYRPEVILLKPYGFWPLGNYYFDNLVFRRCDKAEYDRLKASAPEAPAK